MKEKAARLYPFIANGISLIWLIWWLVPLPPSVDPHGAVKTLGFLVIASIFLVLGILGFYLCYRRFMIFELAASVIIAPPLLALAFFCTPAHSTYLYPIPFIFIIVSSYWFWKYR